MSFCVYLYTAPRIKTKEREQKTQNFAIMIYKIIIAGTTATWPSRAKESDAAQPRGAENKTKNKIKRGTRVRVKTRAQSAFHSLHYDRRMGKPYRYILNRDICLTHRRHQAMTIDLVQWLYTACGALSDVCVWFFFFFFFAHSGNGASGSARWWFNRAKDVLTVSTVYMAKIQFHCGDVLCGAWWVFFKAGLWMRARDFFLFLWMAVCLCKQGWMEKDVFYRKM